MKMIKVYSLPCILKKSFMSELPADLVILSVMIYNRTPSLFAMTDTDVTERVKRVFRFYGNEEEVVHSKMTFIGTVLMADGKVCLHLFEIEQPGSGLLLPS